MSHLVGELSRRRTLSNICSNLPTGARFDVASAIRSHHQQQQQRRRRKWDFGDGAVRGATNDCGRQRDVAVPRNKEGDERVAE